MRAIRITEFGGPEVLTVAEVPDPVPGEDQRLITVDTAGVNYADTHQAEDSYLARQELPMIPGSEVVGRLDDGRRVLAFTTSGGYAEKALAHPSAIVELPDDVTDAQALALFVQGLTAWHLLRTCTAMRPGESVLVHAAAGGVGSLAVQLARHFGAGRVVGLASTEEKRALVCELGADAAVDPAAEDLAGELVRANDGRRYDVVLEMTGGGVFDASLAALGRRGRLATFGMASREPATPIDPSALMLRSQTVTGFWLVHYLDRLREPMAELLDLVRQGVLRPVVGGEYPLEEARAAHEALRARRTTGKLLLTVRGTIP
ncbi:MAG TPA: zinc-binding dehydrogenase [Pseudonocardiaceae bacterium]